MGWEEQLTLEELNFVKLGLEEDSIMCESCKQEMASKRGHGAELCTDCFHEIYDGCP